MTHAYCLTLLTANPVCNSVTCNLKIETTDCEIICGALTTFAVKGEDDDDDDDEPVTNCA